MLIFGAEELLLKEKVTLYNNLATLGSHSGRLLAELEIFPVPRITWDFETFEPRGWDDVFDNGMMQASLQGNQFKIEKPYPVNDGFVTIPGRESKWLRGVATKASIGPVDFEAHEFRFLLPNVCFLRQNIPGFVSGLPGRSISATIDTEWQIEININENAFKWLEPSNRNIGTMLLATGHLKPVQQDTQFLSLLSFENTLERLSDFSLLLSFANGGYLGPLYVEGISNQGDLKAGAMIPVFRVTPLEQIGLSWLEFQSNLTSYLGCFPAFERMTHSEPWENDEFDLILSWYFQAIQPQNGQIGKPWPVVANAIGTALERSFNTIMVRELGYPQPKNKKGLPPESFQRIEQMLTRIGIKRDVPLNDYDNIQNFVNVRNDATHGENRADLSREEIFRTLEMGIQWLEEILLWRLGYSGKYRNRLIKVEDQPRYDLSTRKSDW